MMIHLKYVEIEAATEEKLDEAIGKLNIEGEVLLDGAFGVVLENSKAKKEMPR